MAKRPLSCDGETPALMRSLYSHAETAVGGNAYHSETSPELAHQEDLRDRSQIHSRVLELIRRYLNF